MTHFFTSSTSPVARFGAAPVPVQAVPVIGGEIATRARAMGEYAGWMNQLPNPDPILKARGIDISKYRELLSDGSLSGAVKSRKSALQSMEWGLNRAKSKSRKARLVEDHLKTLDHHRLRSQMFEASLFGYVPIEICKWEVINGVRLPTRIEQKPQEWFAFDNQNRLLFKSKDNWQGEVVPDYQFLCPTNDASYANPYGIGDLSRCFWPSIFKRNGYSFWVTFGERYGMPWVIGKLPRGLDPKEYDALNDRLASMVQDAVAVVPTDADVNLLEAGGKSGSVDVYSRLVEFCKAEMSVVMRGHEGATNSTAGKLGGSDTATKVMDEIRDGDARMCEAAYNQLVRWIYKLNWPSETDIPTFDIWEKKDVDQELATRDATLTEKLGVKFKKVYISEAYDLPQDQFDIEEPKPTAPPAENPAAKPEPGAAVPPKVVVKKKFALPVTFAQQSDAAMALEDAVNSIPAEELQSMMDKLLKPVWKLLQKGTTAEEIQKALVEAYPLMDDDQILTLMTQPIFVADIVGGLSAQK